MKTYIKRVFRLQTIKERAYVNLTIIIRLAYWQESGHIQVWETPQSLDL